MNSQLKLHRLARPHPYPNPNRLPVEVMDMCLRIFAQDQRVSAKHIGPLRLACRHFRDVLTPELFGDVTFLFPPFRKDCFQVFLSLMRKNPDFLKHTRCIRIAFDMDFVNRVGPTVLTTQYIPLLGAISKAPISTLVISGLDEEFPAPVLYNSLDALRCIPTLQNLVVSGTAIPAFLVCGHLGSTRLKTIEIRGASRPHHVVDVDNGFARIHFDGDSILVDEFQPFAKLESLNVPYLAEFPDYFPLHDFVSPHYLSNHRIPFTLPSLTTLQLGNRLQPEDLDDSITLDYNVLGALLSRAPKLEFLSVLDDFAAFNGIDDLLPLVEELPTLKHLKHLELADLESEAGERAIFAMCNIIAASLPLPALETLSIALRWESWHPDATRATLYLSKCWKELQQLLLHPGLKLLHQLKLRIEIRAMTNWAYDDSEVKEGDICPGEIRALKDTLLRLYSLGGKRRVEVDIQFRRPTWYEL